MKKVTIENYRGIDIYFDVSYEKFQCVISDDSFKESKSFSAVKKHIDEYHKHNQKFKPFFVEPHPSERSFLNSTKVEVIGIRKDGDFVVQRPDGKKERFSSYSEQRYVVSDDSNKDYFDRLKALEEEKQKYIDKHNSMKQGVIDKMNLITLKERKRQLGLNEI